jgi:cytochrome c oxidase assembly factor CtaG
MSLASAAAVTLLRLDEPIPDDPVVNYRVLAEKMADEPLPPAPSVQTLLTESLFDPLWIVLIVAGLFCYLAGLRRIMSRGVHWPATRTASWAAGMVVLLYITNGGVNQYQNFLLSTQVLAQMALTTMVALLLVLGRPVGLALLAVRPRKDGSTGVREWIEALAGSPLSRALVHPYVAAGLAAASVLTYYFSPLLEWSARALLGHQWMVAHFLTVGCLLTTSVLRGAHGEARSRRRARNAVLAVAVFYVLLGGWMVTGASLVSADWYAAMERPWGISPLANQRLGGWYVLFFGAVQVAGLTAGSSAGRRSLPPSGHRPVSPGRLAASAAGGRGSVTSQ